MSIAIFICLLSIQTNVMRLCFGMARDDQLPASGALRIVNPRLHTPCPRQGVFAHDAVEAPPAVA